MDTDGSGKLKVSELLAKLKADDEVEALLAAAHPDVDTAKVYQVLEALDPDESGEVTLEEFKASLKPKPAEAAPAEGEAPPAE